MKHKSALSCGVLSSIKDNNIKLRSTSEAASSQKSQPSSSGASTNGSSLLSEIKKGKQLRHFTPTASNSANDKSKSPQNSREESAF
eukprot:2344622-Ditylum_brightwellii.AAC.1